MKKDENMGLGIAAVTCSLAALLLVVGVAVRGLQKQRKFLRDEQQWHDLIRHHGELDAHLDFVWKTLDGR